MSKINQIVENAISSALNEIGVEIVEIDFVKAKGEEVPTLWIYVHHNDGVNLDLLEKINGVIDPIIDEIEVNNGEPYNLNVSSPGLDRPFKTNRDFERNLGNEVEVKLYEKIDGVKFFVGVMTEFDDETVTVDVETKKNKVLTKFERSKIAKISQAIKF